MELREYWRIIRRRWWLPVGLAIAVGLLTVVMQRPWQPRPPSYNATMRFNVGVQPQRLTDVYTYDRYYTMLTSEYLVDDMGEIVRSQRFAEAVSRRLADQGIRVPAAAIGASTQPGKLHRILSVNVSWGDPAQLRAIAEAVAATVTEGSAEFFSQFSAEEADIREQLDLPLRIALALAVGVGLALLLHYLDDYVRDRADLEKLDILVLGEVPRS
jgi:capsular polysaccharide biosynthesis protein